ncbi:MAG TPA: universal stress protein [Candidatus Nitrosotalea sp.]|jgi:nucleotide-binding universal stress UspA family protein|nr:universal stress protein [Candidatus Nitrosotalea sp.]
MTTKRILLATDRSPRADAVAAVVADTARGAHATVRLLHVSPPPSAVYDAEGRVVVYADQETESLRSQGLDYLHTLELYFDVPVESVVRFGDPVTEILAEADAFAADLIVVGTAGRSAIGRVLLGSVAERVFAKATVPVMLLRPTADGAT